MKKTLLIAISFLACSVATQAQTVSFETAQLDSAGYWNGSDGTGSYAEEGFTFSNYYDDAWGSWSGFAVSNIQDDTTGTWSNQFGVNTAMAYSGANFAVATLGATISSVARIVDGFYITNSTYASYSMENGDQFSKKFGGVSGDEADWFKLSVIGKLDSAVIDTVDFYLADFRFEDNTEDYIVSDWTWLDLSSLGNITELSFEWSSSDNGDWGMNTPAYFCMDDLSVNTVGINEAASSSLAVYPNPVKNQFTVNTSGDLFVYDLAGKKVFSKLVSAGESVSVSELKTGIYFVKMGSSVQKIVKL